MRINVYFKEKVIEKIKQKAEEKSMNISEYIRYALIRLWENENEKE